MNPQQQHFAVFLELLAVARANYLWFHGAHHLVTGVSFEGDHKLYSKIYEDYLAFFDALAEKGIALIGPPIADPVRVTTAAMRLLTQYPPPGQFASTPLASASLELEKRFIQQLSKARETLVGLKMLPLGLDNLLAQTADDHDTWIYKLNQRARGGLADGNS
jgi:DNA-binding ferritin-like protein